MRARKGEYESESECAPVKVSSRVRVRRPGCSNETQGTKTETA